MTLNSFCLSQKRHWTEKLLLMNCSLPCSCWRMLTLLGKHECVQNPLYHSSSTNGLLKASEETWNKLHTLFGLYFVLMSTLNTMPFVLFLVLQILEEIHCNYKVSEQSHRATTQTVLLCKTPSTYRIALKSFLWPDFLYPRYVSKCAAFYHKPLHVCAQVSLSQCILHKSRTLKTYTAKLLIHKYINLTLTT